MKTRISKDPNNHRWTKDTTTFGHRILRSQGWTPGSFLGPQDAPHAELHSAASASYIRVTMKDDAGGLGYRAGGGNEDDIAGMDEVKSIFDRLNGVVESEEVKKERERRKALVYLGQKVGGITFVRGGLLVQEGLDMVEMEEKERVGPVEGKGKRKADEGQEEAPRKKMKGDDEAREEKRRRKEEKRRRKERIVESESSSPADSSTPTEDDEVRPKKSKKSRRDKTASEPYVCPDEEQKKKKKRSKSKSTGSSPDEPLKKSKSEMTPPKSAPGAQPKKDKKKDKKSKEERKREKKEKKEERKRLKKAAVASSPQEAELSDTTSADSDAPTGTSTPTSGPGVRHFHHARRVQAKRAAMTDAAALKQILAI